MPTDTLIIVIGVLVNFIAIGVGIYRLGGAMSEFKAIGVQQAREISELKDAVKVISDLMIKMALSTQRQDSFAQRLTLIEKQVDDMRRGEGFILPIFPKAG